MIIERARAQEYILTLTAWSFERSLLPLFIVSTRLPPKQMAFRSFVVSALAVQASAVWLAGVNLSGCELGMDTNVSTATSLRPSWTIVAKEYPVLGQFCAE
jgi:hypothetical protein